MNPGPTWNWQFLPMPADFNAVRNTARAFRRWWPVHGWKPGTTDAEKLRVLCARALHLWFPPATLHRFTQQQVWVFAGPMKPFTLAEWFQKCRDFSDLLDEFLPDGVGMADDDRYKALVAWRQNISGFTPGPSLTDYSWGAPWDPYPAFSPIPFCLAFTLNNGWGVTASEIETIRRAYSFQTERPAWWPLISEPWQVHAAMNGFTTGASYYGGLSDAAKMLCDNPPAWNVQIGDQIHAPSWYHHRGPRHRRQRL